MELNQDKELIEAKKDSLGSKTYEIKSNEKLNNNVAELFYIDKDKLYDILKTAKSKRDKIILLILFETGCTVNELANIRIRDVDSESKKISFIAGITRNNISKQSIISDELNNMIKNYISENNLADKKTSYLLQARVNTHITTKRVRQIIKKLGINNSISALTPQTIRYSHLVYALKIGIPLFSISKQTGIQKSRLVQLLTDIDFDVTEDPYNKFFN